MGTLLILIFVSSIISLFFKVKNKKPFGIILSIIGIFSSIGINLVSSYFYDYMKIEFLSNESPTSVSETVASDFFDEKEEYLLC